MKSQSPVASEVISHADVMKPLENLRVSGFRVQRASRSVSVGGVESGHQGGVEGPVPPHTWVCVSLLLSGS